VLFAAMYKSNNRKISIPGFIVWFIAALLLNSYVPVVQQYSFLLTGIARAGLTLTLFLIGAGLTGNLLQSVGFRPFLQGLVLWIIISAAALWAVVWLA
jgi:uncharacterized membrane protein YadS